MHLLGNNFPFSMAIHGYSGHTTAKLFLNKYFAKKERWGEAISPPLEWLQSIRSYGNEKPTAWQTVMSLLRNLRCSDEFRQIRCRSLHVQEDEAQFGVLAGEDR